MKKLLKRQYGYLILVIAILMVSLGLLGMVIANNYATSARSSTDTLFSTQAFDLALAGLERGKYALLNPNVGSTDPLTQRYDCADINFTNVAFGDGEFSVTSQSTNNTSTTLLVAINASTSIIPLSSLTGFATTGRVSIDGESIDYSGTSTSAGVCGTAPCLTGAVRGADNTVPASHALGASVSQFQCVLQSIGGVPNLTNPKGKRTLRQSIQLQEAWIAGANSSGESTGIWQGVEWERVGPFAGVEDEDFFTITMLTNDDGWAVGEATSANFGGGVNKPPNIAHWNGSAWEQASYDSSIPTNIDAYDIYCVSSNDCWAVGESGSFMRYTGTTWGLHSSVGGQDVRGVFCITTNDCWAVGDSEKFYRYTGTTWSEVTDLGSNNINKLFCLSSNDCWAVGGSAKIYRYTGSTWTEFVDLGGDEFFDLYCSTTNFCAAVGEKRTFYSWNGISWSAMSQSGIPNKSINGVACFNSKDCWAVGDSQGGGALTVHWDGTVWTRIDSPNLPNDHFYGVDVIGGSESPAAMWHEVFN